jgi:hypothetical protein
MRQTLLILLASAGLACADFDWYDIELQSQLEQIQQAQWDIEQAQFETQSRLEAIERQQKQEAYRREMIRVGAWVE